MTIPKVVPIVSAAVIAASGSFAMAAPQAYAAFTSTSSVTGNTVTAGSVVVSLVDALGNAQTDPIVTITNAQPAMASQNSTIRIHNSGKVAADVRLHASNVVAATAANLNQVLVATVRDASNNVLFTGSVADLDLSLSAIASNSTVVMSLAVTWPDLPAVDDNPYQDAALSFALVADAASIGS